jgi:hypothetical protein
MHIPTNKISPSPARDGLIDQPVGTKKSDFGNGDSAFRTYFNAGLATQTLVGVDGIGLATLHLKNLSRTGIYTLFITRTLIIIYNDFPHGTTSTMNE